MQGRSAQGLPLPLPHRRSPFLTVYVALRGLILVLCSSNCQVAVLVLCEGRCCATGIRDECKHAPVIHTSYRDIVTAFSAAITIDSHLTAAAEQAAGKEKAVGPPSGATSIFFPGLILRPSHHTWCIGVFSMANFRT